MSNGERRRRMWKEKSIAFKVLTLLVLVIIILAVVLGPVLALARPPTSTSPMVDWAQISTSQGDRLPDFSYCGYHNSAQALPDSNTAASTTITPNGKDQTDQIQKAINQTAASGGGVVALAAGSFTISYGLKVPGGIILRGAGVNDTAIVSTADKPASPVITLGNYEGSVNKTAYTNITEQYAPIGARNITVKSIKNLQVGQSVYVERAVTAEWVEAMGMANLTRNGTQQTWLEPGKTIQLPNTISSIDNSTNTITLTIPLVDALDSQYMAPQLIAYTLLSPTVEAGIESLSITLNTSCSGFLVGPTPCSAPAISFAPYTIDSYARNLSLHNFNLFVQTQPNSARITLSDIAMFRDADISPDGVALPADIYLQGSQTLVQDCGQYGLATARCFSVMTGSLTPGPNAVMRHVTQSEVQSIYPHQRWAMGLLVEDTDVPVYFVNRGTKGTGHGWAVNGGVGWNLRVQEGGNGTGTGRGKGYADGVGNGAGEIDSPPLGVNWCVGCQQRGSAGVATGGGIVGNGSFVSSGISVIEPRSLFDEQLKGRGLE